MVRRTTNFSTWETSGLLLKILRFTGSFFREIIVKIHIYQGSIDKTNPSRKKCVSHTWLRWMSCRRERTHSRDQKYWQNLASPAKTHFIYLMHELNMSFPRETYLDNTLVPRKRCYLRTWCVGKGIQVRIIIRLEQNIFWNVTSSMMTFLTYMLQAFFVWSTVDLDL